ARGGRRRGGGTPGLAASGQHAGRAGACRITAVRAGRLCYPASAAPGVEEAAALAPPAVAVDEESVAFGEASYLEEELLLEDAIEEDDVEEEPQPAAAVEPWLPKLIEDAP